MALKRCAGLTSWVHLDEKIEETGAAPLSVSRRAVQASDSTRALRSPIVHWSWGSGLGLPPAPLLVGRSLRPGAVAERPCLRLQSFTASSDLPTSHTCHPAPGRAASRSSILSVAFFGTMMHLRGASLTQRRLFWPEEFLFSSEALNFRAPLS